MATEITTRGSFSAVEPPERGTVHATISYEGPEVEPVYDSVARDVAVVKASIGRLMDPGAITSWSAGQLRTWSDRPRTNDGSRPPLVHHAAVGLQAEFRDFDALSEWVGEHVVGTAGFAVSHVNWALTLVRREELISDVRTGAVRDAAARAQVYADALGLGQVLPIAIADPGMLGLRADHGGGDLFAAPAGAPPGSPQVELVPQDITVSAAVDARFVTADA